MEILLAACQAAGLPVPGVAASENRQPMTPKMRQMVAYLQKLLLSNPELARLTQITLFRFQEAKETLIKAEAAMLGAQPEEALFKDLKLRFHYLANLHEQFKGDPLLAELFPSPDAGPIAEPPAGSGPLARGTIRDTRIGRVESQLAVLAPAMARAGRLVEIIDRPKRGLTDMLNPVLNPGERQNELLAKAIKDDPEALDMLRRALHLYRQLQAQLELSRSGGPPPVPEILNYLGGLRETWGQHLLLKFLFTADDPSTGKPRR